MEFIVAVDGSEPAEKALEHAIELAIPADAAIAAVHAVDPSVYEEAGSEPPGDIPDAEERLIIESVEDAEGRGADILDAAARSAREAGLEATTELLYGDPPNAIADYAEERGADGIFVGHRGLSERAERVLGSVAKDLVELATVPVTVVR